MNYSFKKSDIGAQAAWKGFSSQTLYIASRVICDTDGYQFYPEDIEDLVVKNGDKIIEAVQVKNISSDLTLSSLASTKTSRNGEGFFNRMCSFHTSDKDFNCVKVAYFGNLGAELLGLRNNVDGVKEQLIQRLVNNHGLSKENAIWFLEALVFEKVTISQLEQGIKEQISKYVPAMSAPDLVQALLVQYVSNLSKSKGFTSLLLWQDTLHKIATDITSIDGYFKEYGKSLVRLDEFVLNREQLELENEFAEGVSSHPTYIRMGLDFRRDTWLERIDSVIQNNGVALVKGVSGQGKSTLCYRYLIDNYPEEFVFCVRSVSSQAQAENLVSALIGLAKHSNNIIIYIDVIPGEHQWSMLLQEIQARGLSIPVLISIRDEDFNMTRINGKAINYDIIELLLTEDEARNIYNKYTASCPHSELRSFDEAWSSFGSHGPLIEFVYWLTKNQSLTERLNQQLDTLLLEQTPDSWFDILNLACFSGKLGCSISYDKTKTLLNCDTMHSALKRFSDEYLLKISDDGLYIETLHPVRARIIYDLICQKNGDYSNQLIISALKCVKPENVKILLLDYFTNHPYSKNMIERIASLEFSNWLAYGDVIKVMLWLDAKRYAESNCNVINDLIKERGKGWLCFLPLDLTGIDRPNELIAEGMLDLSIIVDKDAMKAAIQKVKDSLTSLIIDYEATDIFINKSRYPTTIPKVDYEWSMFGYSLFWLSKRQASVSFAFTSDELIDNLINIDLQAGADAVRGLYEHSSLREYYEKLRTLLEQKIINDLQVITYEISDKEIACKFVPPSVGQNTAPENTKNINQYWRIRMLDILKQLYPQVDYIDIELLGVDLLKDLGIAPLDHKIHISKENRHNGWISEVNSWVKTRIDFSLRPLSWNDYISEIDNLRIISNNLVTATIKSLDGCYRKKKLGKENWDKVVAGVAAFKKFFFAENRLPTSAVDPYCLYTESMQKEPSEKVESIVQFTSFDKYKIFRKSLSETFSSLENFYNQFSDILVLRLKYQPIDTNKNGRLSLYNLYSAAKNLATFTAEYDRLFAQYSTLPVDFAIQETENLLTLVNIWNYVLNNPIRGLAVAYDARQKYRKGRDYFTQTLANAALTAGCSLNVVQDQAYVISEFDFSTNDNTLENEYSRIVLEMRKIFKDAIPFSSNRWFVETQNIEISYLPVNNGVPLGVGFLIPFYKLLDTDNAHISDSMLPCELSPSLYDTLDIKQFSDLSVWNSGMKCVGTIRTLLEQYTLVLDNVTSEICENGWETYSSSLCENIDTIWNEFERIIPLIENLQVNAEDEKAEWLKCIKIFYGYRNNIFACIKKRDNVSNVIDDANIIAAIMLLLLRDVTDLNVKWEG